MATRSLPTQTANESLEPLPSNVVHLAAEDASSTTISRPAQPWQRDGWRFYDLHGEVHYPLGVGSNLCARVDLDVQQRTTKGWAKTAQRDAAAALDTVTSIGLDDYFRSVWLNTAVAGEGVLTIRDDAGGYSIEVFSNIEMYQDTDRRWVRVDEIGQREYVDMATTRVTRFWRNHPKYRRNADSGLRSVVNECRELELLKLALLAKITSRLASVGILFLPNSLSMTNPDPEAAAGTLSGDALTQILTKLFMSPLKNPGSAAGAMPVFLRGPDDAGEKIRHIILDTALDEVEEHHRAELRRSIAQGIELPYETQTGVGDVNRWNAWNISESALRDHALPICRSAANLLTTRVLWPWLRSTGMAETDVRTYRFWPNVDRAALGLNRSNNALQLYDRGELGGVGLREAFGYDETAKPSALDVIRWIGIKLNNPAMAAYQLGVPPDVLNFSPTPPGPGGFDASEPAVDSSNTVGNPNDGLDGS